MQREHPTPRSTQKRALEAGSIIEQLEIGTFPNGTASRTWQVRWTAPSTDIGTVRFWFAGNAANGNGDNQGDYIYTSNASSDSPTSAVTVTLQSQPGGLMLAAGSQNHGQLERDRCFQYRQR